MNTTNQTNIPSWEPHGKAIEAYWEGNKKAKIGIHMEDGESIEMPASIYFRDSSKMPEIEKVALDFCSGRVLDVGAGAGAHVLLLLDQGLEPTALDIDPNCVSVMKERGIEEVVCIDFLNYKSKLKYDTLLFLMNGIGVAGNLEQLKAYLKHAHELSHKQGQIILDSSDLRISNPDLDNKNEYFGEVSYQLSFENQKGSPYSWLYVDFDTLSEVAADSDWEAEIIYETDDGQYLARLTKLTA